MKKTIVWFRNDLRCADNPALYAAAQVGEVIPLFIWAPEEEGSWAPGEMSRAWLKLSLAAFNRTLGGKLVLRKGPSLKTLLSLVKESGVQEVFFNRRYEPEVLKRDCLVQEELTRAGITVHTFNGSLLVEPWEVETRLQKPYQVFTPFWKTCLKLAPFIPVGTPKVAWARALPPSLALEKLALPDRSLPVWEIGEEGAMKRLHAFLKKGLDGYDTFRDRPDLDGVSRLSPHLHFGEISPRQIWAQTKHALGFTRQLMWREFAHHLLYHFPSTPDFPLHSQFSYFPWRDDPQGLQAWKGGRTGFPIVDAGMRQLLVMGWMHNRVRLIVASFLTKDLLIPWQEGAKWFWETLVDADLANNTLGWQWTAGCGADAAPYFRIFNPTVQGERFDPQGDYIRTFVPELRDLPLPYLHRPWEASQPPRDYPPPLVDHPFARERALHSFEKVKTHENRHRRK